MLYLKIKVIILLKTWEVIFLIRSLRGIEDLERYGTPMIFKTIDLIYNCELGNK